MRLPRLFVAVWPTSEACADLSLLPRKDQPGIRFVPEENWHVTLRFLGDAHPREVAEALDEVTFPTAEVRLGPVVEYLGDEQLVHLIRKDTPLLAKLPVEQQLETGRDEQFAVARDKVVLFDAETQERVG